MKKIVLTVLIATSFISCKKGLIFDKEMVIGNWRMWELYTPGSIYYWTFTEDSVFIFVSPDSLNASGKDSPKQLVYKQADWNTGTFDINLFETSNPFDSTKTITCFIDIAKYNRDYLVISADDYNWSATLSREK